MCPEKSGLTKNRIFIIFCVILASVGIFAALAVLRTKEPEALVASHEPETQVDAASDVNEDNGEKPADSNDSNDGDDGEHAKDKKVRPPDHNHPAFSERVKQRQRMVRLHIKEERIEDANVLEAMRTVPRHSFVKKVWKSSAYENRPLPIGMNQTISQPYVVAYMTEALQLDPNSRVFEVGTGSGYQAAVCAEIAREVYTVEIIKVLAESAKKRLKRLGYHNVTVSQGDGYYGWKEKGPFDAIIVTAAAGLVPPPLKNQLKPGGRMILPLGSPYGVQTLVLITKDKKGNFHSRRLLPVRFVPMTGKVQEVEK